MTRNNYNLLPTKKTGHSLQKWKVPKFARLNQIMLTYRISKFSRVQGCLSKIPNLNMHRRVTRITNGGNLVNSYFFFWIMHSTVLHLKYKKDSVCLNPTDSITFFKFN